MKRLVPLTIVLAVCDTAVAAASENRPAKTWNRSGPLVANRSWTFPGTFRKGAEQEMGAEPVNEQSLRPRT